MRSKTKTMPPPSASRRGSLDGQREASRRHSLPLSSPRPGLVRQNATKILLHKSSKSAYRMGNDLGEDMRLYWQYGKKFIHDSLGIVFMGVGLGLLSLYLFCAEDPKALPKDTHGWPEVAALPLALSIIGSALSFLPGQDKGDSTSLQRECSARARSRKRIYASRPFREMIARPKISRNEWKTAEI